MLKTITHYQQLFANHIPADALTPVRNQAIDAFSAMGFPTNKTESWKYLRLTVLREQAFTLMPTSTLDPAVLTPLLLADCYHVVCLNGALMPQHCTVPQGVSALRARLDESAIQTLIAQSDLSLSLVALNTALFQDGLVIDVHTKLDKPLHCLFLTDDAGALTTSQQRHVVRLGADAAATIIAEHVSLTTTAFFTNAVWHLELAERANGTYYQVFNDNPKAIHIDHCILNQQAHSVYQGLSFLSGGALVRTDLEQRFLGEHASCSVKGLTLAQEKQQLDQHLRLSHSVAHCYSEQFFKGLALDQSRLIFNGKVIVDQDAQKTDAHQHTKHLLLSSTAEIYTKPELEIYANDVKCAHGATIGQLSDEALFYLKSRGITDARAVLIKAFNQELLDLLKWPVLKARVSALFAVKA